MKLMTILGTRPEIIRLCLVIKKIDEICEHVLVHTGQNYVASLGDIFFKELNLREPNYFLGVKGDTFGEQIGKILIESEKVILKENPDVFLILGDTNSGLSSIIAKRLGIQVFHMEAGNRCFDDRVPEEVNRRIIDHSSSILLPYTHRSKENLLKEGIDRRLIYVTGNPIYEVLETYKEHIVNSQIHKSLKLEYNKYFLVTMHRAENVDHENRLRSLINSLKNIYKRYEMPIICSLHPRTKSKMEKFGITIIPQIQFLKPLGFFDFVCLEKHAFCVLSDSGTVQEECCILHVSNVTIRDVTERPETIECGSNILSGCEPEKVMNCVQSVLSSSKQWNPPYEYLERDVSEKVVKIIMSNSIRNKQIL